MQRFRCGFVSFLWHTAAVFHVWLQSHLGTPTLLSQERQSVSVIRVSEGSRSLQGYLEKRLESKKKKPPLLPCIRKIALSVHLTTTIKSRAIKRCIKYMPFLHPFLSSLQNTTSFLLYFSPFKSYLSLNGGK